MEADSKAYCGECYYGMFAPSCAACEQSIMGDAVNALGKQYHVDCFVCAVSLSQVPCSVRIVNLVSQHVFHPSFLLGL